MTVDPLTLNISPELLRLAARMAIYRKSFERFASEQLKIKHKMKGVIEPFRLNPPQQALDSIVEEQLRQNGRCRLCVLKARQPGASTYTVARGFHRSALNSNVNQLVLAQDKDTAEHIFTITKLFYDCLEAEIRPLYRYSTKHVFTFENPDEKTRTEYPGLRSRITFQSANNPHAGTGQTIQFLHCSEASKWNDAFGVTQSLFPSVPSAPGTFVIIESTAWPTGDWFKNFCEQAAAGKQGEYRFVFLPWFLSPEYTQPLDKNERLHLTPDEHYFQNKHGLTNQQLKWRRTMIDQFGGGAIGETKFNCEYPAEPDLAWVSWDLCVYDMRKILEMQVHIRPPERRADIFPGPKILDNPSGELSIWIEPQKGETYDIGVDTASGVQDGDWSVAEVINRRTHEQVAEYRQLIGPLDFAEKLNWLGYYYNLAQIGVEVNGVGFATNDALQKIGYPYTYIWRQRSRAVPTLSMHSGWKTQPDSKAIMVALSRHMLAHDQVKIHSRILLEEMRKFCSVPLPGGGEAYRGTAGSHDDCVCAWAISLVISDDESFGVSQEVAGLSRGPEKRLVRDPSQSDDFDNGGIRRRPLDQLANDLKGFQ